MQYIFAAIWSASLQYFRRLAFRLEDAFMWLFSSAGEMAQQVALAKIVGSIPNIRHTLLEFWLLHL